MDSQKSTDHLYVAEILNNFLKSEGLATSQYKQFWQTLTSTDATTSTYLVVLLTKLLLMELNEDKQPTQLLDYVQKILRNEQINIPSNGTPQLEDDAVSLKQSVLNTIYFVTLFYSFENEDNNLKNVITKVQQAVSSDKKGVADSFIDEIVKMISVSLESNDRTISLIDQCSNIELSTFDWGQSVDKSEAKYGSLSYIDIYLRNTLREGGIKSINRSKLIFETILLFLKHPLLSEKRMLSLLHMLKNYIIKSPKVLPDVLSSALSIVRPYYLWPRPHSDVARDVLQLLTIELKSPGAAFRKVLAEECPELSKGSTKTGKERYVYLLVDETSTNARKLREMIRNTTNTTDINISILQLNLLANILSSALLVEHDSLGLESLPREELSKYYEAAVQILSEAVLMNQEDAEGYRIKELTALKTEIDTTLSSVSSSSSTIEFKPKHPTLPSLSFQIHSTNFDNSTKTSSFVGNLKYPKRSCMDNLSNILEQYAPFADPKNKPVVKIGIVGGDGALHNFVTSYVCLKSTNQKLFEGVELQVFMVPSEPNDFCIFLSKYDGWFARQIYLAMYSIFRLLPGIFPSPPAPVTVSKEGPLSTSLPEMNKPKAGGIWGANDVALQEQLKATLSSRTIINVNPLSASSTTTPSRSKSESSLLQDLKSLYDIDDKISNPSQILRATLENYFREAKVKLDMCLYQCECWSENSYYTVPFCQRIELGIKPFTKAFQKSNELPESMSVSSIQQHKSFKYSPPGYTIKYTQMNLVGAVKQAPPMESRAYQSIVIANVPYHGDKGVTPNPTKPYLEMLTVESDSKKRKGKGKDSDDATCYHVSLVDIECEDKKKMFHILLDNVLYGPFCRIRVTPSNVSQEEILTLPVMTFFPLDL